MSTVNSANTAQYIWQDSPSQIWNDLRSPTYYYGSPDLYPAFAVITIFTVIHYIMDMILYFSAKEYANKEVDIDKPKWVTSSKYASELTYNKLSHITKRKFAKIMKKYELDSTDQQKELISYQTRCSKHAKCISKFKEASFKVLVFGFVYFYGLGLIFVDGKWFWDQQWMWSQSLPQSVGNNAIFNLDIYYYLQIGYHGHRAIYQFFEHKRRDFWPMFIHHWVTVFLLCGSKIVGFQQIGATVLLCNDNVDLFLPAAKITEYTGYKTLCKIFQGLFIVLFPPLRIGVYFYKVLYSIGVDGYSTIRVYVPCWICLVGLIIIYALQFVWTKLILEMVWTKLLKGQGVVDTRSDTEDVSKSESKQQN